MTNHPDDSTLLAYHLGAFEERDALDAHLLGGCTECLRRYLAHKRACEDATLGEERPGPAARERLRHDVARQIGAPVPLSAPWARRVAWGAAVAAAATLAVLAARGYREAHLRPHGDGALIDADQAQASLTVL